MELKKEIRISKNDLKLVYELIGYFVINGKKAYAERQVFKALYLLKLYYFRNPLKELILIIEYLKPGLSLNVVKKGQTSIQLPSFAENKQKYNLSLSWLAKSVKNRKEKHLYEKIFFEILAILKNRGETVKKKRFHNILIMKSKSSFRFLKEKSVIKALSY